MCAAIKKAIAETGSLTPALTPDQDRTNGHRSFADFFGDRNAVNVVLSVPKSDTIPSAGCS